MTVVLDVLVSLWAAVGLLLLIRRHERTVGLIVLGAASLSAIARLWDPAAPVNSRA